MDDSLHSIAIDQYGQRYCSCGEHCWRLKRFLVDTNIEHAVRLMAKARDPVPEWTLEKAREYVTSRLPEWSFNGSA